MYYDYQPVPEIYSQVVIVGDYTSLQKDIVDMFTMSSGYPEMILNEGGYVSRCPLVNNSLTLTADIPTLPAAEGVMIDLIPNPNYRVTPLHCTGVHAKLESTKNKQGRLVISISSTTVPHSLYKTLRQGRQGTLRAVDSNLSWGIDVKSTGTPPYARIYQEYQLYELGKQYPIMNVVTY